MLHFTLQREGGRYNYRLNGDKGDHISCENVSSKDLIDVYLPEFEFLLNEIGKRRVSNRHIQYTKDQISKALEKGHLISLDDMDNQALNKEQN